MNETVGTIVLTVVGWLASEKFLFPQLVKLWNWVRGIKKEIDEENVDASKEILNVKEQHAEIYESQINFLMNQIDRLEKEINQHQEQLSKMRSMVLELNSRLFKKDVIIGKLRELCCANINCKYREYCTDEVCSNAFDILKENNNIGGE